MSQIRKGITVIIPAYNYAQYLPDAIDSLSRQTVPFAKIVVVNDGSTDDTASVLESYRGVVEIINIENRGQLGACFEGMKNAESDYVYFLDADDFVADNMNQELQKHILSNPAKIQFQLRAVDSRKRQLDSVFPTFPAQYNSSAAKIDNRSLGFYISPPTSGNIYRRDVLCGLDSSLMSAYDFIDGTPNLIMPYRGEIISLNVQLAFYRIHDDSDSHRGGILEKLTRELRRFEERWREAENVLGWSASIFTGNRPAYVVERSMMQRVLEKRGGLLADAFAYLKVIYASRLPLRQKVVLTAWSASLMLPFHALRSYAVEARRSASSRPRSVQRILFGLLRPQV
jgi:glycosyltransferase involved in cell wall biosynthesis